MERCQRTLAETHRNALTDQRQRIKKLISFGDKRTVTVVCCLCNVSRAIKRNKLLENNFWPFDFRFKNGQW